MREVRKGNAICTSNIILPANESNLRKTSHRTLVHMKKKPTIWERYHLSDKQSPKEIYSKNLTFQANKTSRKD